MCPGSSRHRAVSNRADSSAPLSREADRKAREPSYPGRDSRELAAHSIAMLPVLRDRQAPACVRECLRPAAPGLWVSGSSGRRRAVLS